MHIGLHHRAVLVRAVVIRGDAARAIVHTLAHRGVAQIRQMVGLRTPRQRGIFDLDKVADMHLGPQHRAGPQAGKWANQCALAHRHAELFAVDVGKRMNHRARRNFGICNHAIRANAHALPQADLAVKHAIHINLDILRAGQRAAHIQPRRVSQPHALLHQANGQALLIHAFQFGQLHRAVDAGDLRGIKNLVRHHGHAVSHRKLHDVGQVILVLRILVVQTRQPAAQQLCGHGHDAAVDFMNGALGVAGVFVLDDGAHLGGRLRAGANDAAIAGRVGHVEGQ